MSMQQAEREFLLWCYRLMHWGLDGCLGCWFTLNFTGFLKNALCQSAPYVFSWYNYFIVCRHEMEILAEEGFEWAEGDLSSFRQIVPMGLSKCQGIEGTNEVIPQTLKPYYRTLALHYVPVCLNIPWDISGLWWSSTDGLWRMFPPTSVTSARLSLPLAAAAWLSAN